MSGSPFPLPLEPGELVLRSGSANMQRGAETVGGTLHLSTARLVFVPHAMNVQSAPSQLPVSSIAQVTTAWSKLLGVLPLAPNSIELALYDGSSQSYVVTGRKAWIAAIDQARGGGVPVG